MQTSVDYNLLIEELIREPEFNGNPDTLYAAVRHIMKGAAGTYSWRTQDS